MNPVNHYDRRRRSSQVNECRFLTPRGTPALIDALEVMECGESRADCRQSRVVLRDGRCITVVGHHTDVRARLLDALDATATAARRPHRPGVPDGLPALAALAAL